MTSWGKTNTKTLQPLITAQKGVLRIMINSTNRNRSDPLYMKLQLLKLDAIYKLQVAIVINNVSNKIWNIDSQTQPITSINPIHKHQTRLVKKNNYHLHSIRTNLGKSTIAFAGPEIWSEIPQYIKLLQKHQFKKEYKKLLLNSCNQFFFVMCVFAFFFCVLLFPFFCCYCCCFGFIMSIFHIYIFNI